MPTKTTNGEGGLKWATIGKICKAVSGFATIAAMVLGVGFAHYVQVERLQWQVEQHCDTDKVRHDELVEDIGDVENRVRVTETAVAAMRGGE